MADKREDLEIVVGVDNQGLASNLGKTAQLLRGLARNFDAITPKAKDFAPVVDTAGFVRGETAAKSAGLSFRSAAADLAGFTAKAAIAGGTLIAMEAGFSGLGDTFRHVKEAVSLAAEFEQNTIAFEAMLGSAEKTTKVLGDLRKFAADTPFSSKDVTQGAKQLLAYGFAAEDLIPSLKVIGTLAAGVGKPIGELLYNVGTTRVQGRATQLDINQLSDKGIDVYPGLAKALKVDQAEVRKFVEEGRVDWNIYKSVLEDLARTRFAGLLEKQADSLKGSWEQLTDAFDRAKLKLGQVIAQEAGLKGSARSLENFAGELERAIDSEHFRGGVRLISDIVKGGAQIAYEFGKAGVAVASLNLDAFAKTSPEVAALAENIRTMVGDLQNFKLNKRAIVEFGFGLFDAISYPISQLAETANTQGKKFKDGFQENFIDPLNQFLSLLEDVKGLVPAALKERLTAGRESFDARTYLRSRGVEVPEDA